MARRLLALSILPSPHPSENWKTVLKAMNRDLDGEGLDRDALMDERLQTEVRARLGMEVFPVKLSSKGATTFPVVVTLDYYLSGESGEGGDAGLKELAIVLARAFRRGCILLTRRAMFIERAGNIFTRAFVVLQDSPHLHDVALSLFGGMPENLVEQATKNVRCGTDDLYADNSCAISIAVNTLDDGVIPAEGARIDSTWMGVGHGWRMPFVPVEQSRSDG